VYYFIWWLTGYMLLIFFPLIFPHKLVSGLEKKDNFFSYFEFSYLVISYREVVFGNRQWQWQLRTFWL